MTKGGLGLGDGRGRRGGIRGLEVLVSGSMRLSGTDPLIQVYILAY